MLDSSNALWALAVAAFAALAYLVRINQQLSGTPEEVRRLSGPRWTPDLLRETYERLQQQPIDYTHKLPPKLDRRYVVTGGSGLVGGCIVLQLLARGTPPTHIRILDIRRTERGDMRTGPAAAVEFVQTDITSRASVDAAFARPWPSAAGAGAARQPLTVFHTAAVILASERSARSYGFPESVNVRGTANVLAAARAAGATVFSATSSASIAIRPVGAWAAPWAAAPAGFFQALDARDFGLPPRPREGYFGNYPATKAAAERLVCDADRDGFRTGTIRPANGVYGNPTDNTVGDPLSRAVLPTWVNHIVQSFVHGANVAIAHLHHEAALLQPSASAQSGRPFVVTDPNPPISYGDLYLAIKVLSRHPFTTVSVPPVLILLLSHAVEMYSELPFLPFPFSTLGRLLPPLQGDVRHLKPGIFSITTHLVATNSEASKPVSEGGLGYEGVITTLEGMALEVLEWNREHEHLDEGKGKTRKAYTTSISLAEKIQKLGSVGHQIAA
ncbi:putative cholesterol dehydrogenase [Rosellinia necatrix]|uniref:Putative cholesterol dehydrogenase n=1 Tax=Rosellinia necatrix TaxID=77044 RepID=A0A1S7UNN4_ROSNE|nr:putative cholesterol dehydrogenase [Rosellinia necatrix]